MAWQGSLSLDYRLDEVHGAPRSVVRDRHDGPLRVLASLYPEAAQVCHNVLVHPPGGLVGGDRLDIAVTLAPGAHALITTPGATRFYRSTGATATQQLNATLADGARLEWLPLETLAYSGCLAENAMRFELSPGAEMIGWDVLALGLPASDRAFVHGRFEQRIELPGRWLERGVIDAADTRLLDSPLGWDGQRVMGTLWFAAGAALPTERREALLDAARAAVAAVAAAATAPAPATDPASPAAEGLRPVHAGATAVHDGIVVLRVLGPRVEPVMALLARAWALWRDTAWQLPACTPRVWRT
ncbi:MAG TPA: urease accessory protein UreD [Burkholderiaceae bacterium]|jgi:urease accessory protein